MKPDQCVSFKYNFFFFLSVLFMKCEFSREFQLFIFFCKTNYLNISIAKCPFSVRYARNAIITSSIFLHFNVKLNVVLVRNAKNDLFSFFNLLSSLAFCLQIYSSLISFNNCFNVILKLCTVYKYVEQARYSTVYTTSLNIQEGQS